MPETPSPWPAERRRARAGFWVVPIVVLLGCTTHQKRTVLDLDCERLKLRFEERCVTNFSGTSCSEFLVAGKGKQWVEVDEAIHGGPESYSRLLPLDVGFRPFPFDDKRKRDTSRSRWGVFANPAVVSRVEYDTMATCLAANLARIDQVFAAGNSWDDRHRPQLVSIVHAAYDPELALCGPKTIGTRWTCGEGEAYIKTRVRWDEAPFILCTQEPQTEGGLGDGVPGVKVTTIPNGMVVGKISTDQRGVFLAPPDKYSYEYKKLLASNDANAYYATCRDATGKRFLDTFPPCR